MEARDCAVLFELDARAVSFDDVRAGSDKQVFYSGSLDGSRDRIFENRHERSFSAYNLCWHILQALFLMQIRSVCLEPWVRIARWVRFQCTRGAAKIGALVTFGIVICKSHARKEPAAGSKSGCYSNNKGAVSNLQ